jgi:hypothetical protein
MEFSRWLQHVPWVVAITGNAVQISIVWVFHFLGYFLVVGSTTIVDLRILGLAGRNQSLEKLGRQLFPWMWVGLVFVTISGLIMFAGYAAQFYPAGVFRIKVLVFIVAIVFGVLVQRGLPKWEGLSPMPGSAKALAVISLVLWLGMILASVEVPAFIPCI